jgi:sortase A
MLLRDLRRRFASDPLLKVGVGAMVVALGFAIVVAVAAFLERPIEPAAAKSEVKPATEEPLVRSDPGVDPWVEKDIPPPRTKVTPSSHAPSTPAPEPRPAADRPEGPGSRDTPDRSRQTTLPLEANNYPLPTNEQLRATHSQRHYYLPPGAIMSLTVRSIGIDNAPVMNSNSRRALDMGVVHLPDTSLPWSDTPERNVYLAGHRLGWPGTGSHLIFYRLDELQGGERITLRDRSGTSYDYRVLESFTVGPHEGWVTGRVRGRDLLTLQTCTPIPTFQKRLIVRAERV